MRAWRTTVWVLFLGKKNRIWMRMHWFYKYIIKINVLGGILDLRQENFNLSNRFGCHCKTYTYLDGATWVTITVEENPILLSQLYRKTVCAWIAIETVSSARGENGFRDWVVLYRRTTGMSRQWFRREENIFLDAIIQWSNLVQSGRGLSQVPLIKSKRKTLTQ